MPMFYFDSDDGERFTKDRSGVELADLQAAVHEAAGLLRDLAHAEDCVGHRTMAAIVRDTSGRPLYRATMTMTGVLIASQEASSGAGGRGLPLVLSAASTRRRHPIEPATWIESTQAD